MRFIYLSFISLMIFGCSGAEVTRDINKVQIAMAGNKPPTSFKVANLQTMKDYVFNMDGYTVAMPSAKQKDFTLLDGWGGLTHYNRDITLYLLNKKHSLMYNISVTQSKVSEYGERERTLENGTRKFSQERKTPSGDTININVHREFKGRENYPCVVSESINKSNGYRIGYRCYKFNKARSKFRYVSVRFTYHKPKKPTLAKQYTYADLKRRAKRMLDSLYIKDGW